MAEVLRIGISLGGRTASEILLPSTNVESVENREERFVSMIAESQLALRVFLRVLVRCSTDVDDVLQEVNVVLWRKRSEFDWGRNFMPWACRVAQLQAMAHLKRNRNRRSEVMTDEILSQVAVEAARYAEQSGSQIEALRECLGRLTTRQRQLVQRRYGDADPVRKIAQEDGRSADAVSMVLYRVRKNLADCVQRKIAMEGSL